MIKRIDGKELSNLERAALKWFDVIIEDGLELNSIYRVSDGVTFYPTSDGQIFKDLKAAQDHERKYLLDGYEHRL